VLARVKTHLTIQSLHKELQQKNAELEEKNIRLQEALDNVKTLQGMLPICSICKKIRDDRGYWIGVTQLGIKHKADLQDKPLLRL
jgi:hypothetical protein